MNNDLAITIVIMTGFAVIVGTVAFVAGDNYQSCLDAVRAGLKVDC